MVRVKRIQAALIAGLLLSMLLLPQLALAAGPEISGVSWDITDTTATIIWTTNTSSDGRVYYGTTKPPSSHEDESNGGGTDHSITLEELEPATKYYFAVESTDTSGTSTDDNGGEYYSFTTLPLIEYAISLSRVCGYCGDQIEVTATVEAPGNYRICWAPETTETLTSTHSKKTFTASSAGSYTVAFLVPDTEKGVYTVHLTREDYTKLAEADFEVLLFVKINPEEGPVGTEVTISGSGFAANQNIRVKFFQGEDQKGDAKTDKSDTNGRWDLSYTIPETPSDDPEDPDDDYAFIVEFQEGGVWYDLAPREFTVTPEITAPSSGTVGHTIKVEGTGFRSEEEDIEITFDGEMVKSDIPADKDGSWSADIVIPFCQHGEHTIDASGEDTRARDVPDIEDFIVEAGILLDPDSAYVGETITIAGAGFESEETGIKVTFAGTIVKSGITAKEDGTWESSFDLPVSTFGSHTVEASGDRTSAVTTTLNTKAKIEEPSPDEGAPGDSVSLTGSGFHGSQELTVTIGGVEVTDNLQTQSNGNVVINFHVPEGSPEGRQKLVVTDEDGATHDDDIYFTVTEKALSTTPLPISPKDSTLRSGEVTFKWQGVSGDTGYTYTLEISKTAGSANIWSKSGIEESSYTLTDTETVTETLPKGTYYWRVKIVDDYGNESAWSDSTKFTVSPIPTWVWVVVGLVVLVVLMVVAYRETKFKVTE
jgi:hypothetical protein